MSSGTTSRPKRLLNKGHYTLMQSTGYRARVAHDDVKM